MCSGVYGVFTFLLRLMFGYGLVESLVVTAIALPLATLYFWLLAKTEGSGWFWLIFILGIVIGVV